MKRVLSLLLLVPFLITQVLTVAPAFARGGPYDDMMSRRQSTLAGTYGVALTGSYAAPSEIDASAGKLNWEKGTQFTPDPTSDSSITGVLAFSIPALGLASGRMLLFDRGLMYLGTAQGMADSRDGTVTLLAQLSHYFVRSNTDGATQPTDSSAVDSIYSGQIKLSLSLDYFTGVIQAFGDAKFTEYSPLTGSVSVSTTTKTTDDTGSGPGISTTSTTSDTSGSTNTATSTEADGSTTALTTGSTKTDTTTSTSANTKTTTIKSFNTDTQASTDAKRYQLALQLTASGVRQSTTVSNIAAFTVPSAATSFQINSPTATAGP